MTDPFKPRDVLAILFRHKKKAIGCCLLVVGSVVIVTALLQPRFRSEAMLFVRLGRENVALDPTASMGSGLVVAIPQAREEEINSVVEILKSQALVEKIVDQVGPGTILGDEQADATTAPVAQEATNSSSSPHWLQPYLQRLGRAIPSRRAIRRWSSSAACLPSGAACFDDCLRVLRWPDGGSCSVCPFTAH